MIFSRQKEKEPKEQKEKPKFCIYCKAGRLIQTPLGKIYNCSKCNRVYHFREELTRDYVTIDRIEVVT